MLHTELENLLVESVCMEIAHCMFEAKEIEEILFSNSIRLGSIVLSVNALVNQMIGCIQIQRLHFSLYTDESTKLEKYLEVNCWSFKEVPKEVIKDKVFKTVNECFETKIL